MNHIHLLSLKELKVTKNTSLDDYNRLTKWPAVNKGRKWPAVNKGRKWQRNIRRLTYEIPTTYHWYFILVLSSHRLIIDTSFLSYHLLSIFNYFSWEKCLFKEWKDAYQRDNMHSTRLIVNNYYMPVNKIDFIFIEREKLCTKNISILRVRSPGQQWW